MNINKYFYQDKAKFSYLSVQLLMIVLTGIFISGCNSDDEIFSTDRPVIDGWISSDSNPVVIFTSSFSGKDDNILSDKIIKYGKVTISDGEKEIILTAGAAKNYFPPFRYYNYEMKGIPGKTYKVTAEYKGMKAEADGYMFPATPIDSIEIKKIGSNDSLRAVTLYFTSPEDVPAYYYVTLQEGKRNSRPLPAMLGTIKVDNKKDKVSIPIFRPHTKVDSLMYVAYLREGESWIINLNRVDEKTYRFWRDYDNSVSLGNSPFLSNQNHIEGNVKGGYGIFSVQGTASLPLKIK